MFATVFTCTVSAQTQAPCKPGDSLLSLGKAGFFRSIEHGAFAIGERTLDDLTDGLSDTTRAKAMPGVARKRVITPRSARAAVFTGETDTTLAESMKAYVDSPSSDAADAGFSGFLEKASKILFERMPDRPGVPGTVGLALEDGRLSNRGVEWAVPEMADERRRQKLEDMTFGSGPDLLLGQVDKMLGASPFFKAPVIADARNVDRNNIGISVTKESELRDLWFKDYRAYLSKGGESTDATPVRNALNAGWPTLQKFWAFKRTEIFVTRGQTAFGLEMREIYSRYNKEDLPVVGCESARR
ncbi:MAG: hypothetical protein ABI565_07870 [Vicinamibacteria bacterium]